VAVVSAVLDLRANRFPKDAVAISSIVILNGILGYLQESRAKSLSPQGSLLRWLELCETANEVEAETTRTRDVMLLEAGVQLAADGRLIEEQNCKWESALTGEASRKQAKRSCRETSLGDRVIWSFKEPKSSRDKVVVTGTGMQTELGRLLRCSSSRVSRRLQKRMSQLGNVLVSGSHCALVVIGGILQSSNFNLKTISAALKSCWKFL